MTGLLAETSMLLEVLPYHGLVHQCWPPSSFHKSAKRALGVKPTFAGLDSTARLPPLGRKYIGLWQLEMHSGV